MKTHKKTISNQEIEIIALLKELSLAENTLIHSVQNNILIEYEGYHIERAKWRIIKMYKEAIMPFHSIHSKRFTPGIYSFMSSNMLSNETDYRRYLLSELERIIVINSPESETTHLKKEIYTVAKTEIEGLIRNDIEIKDFCLLHGDLYNGNILIYDDRYSLIDFEYLRFGPSQMEWAFLLFWDTITELNNHKRKNCVNSIMQNIAELKEAGILTNTCHMLIINMFLPVLLCTVLQYCENKKYENTAEILQGISKFWRYEYCLFKERGE